MSEFAKFAPLLRKRGFKKDWDSRSGGIRIVEWVKHVGERKIRVQVWAHGTHRASHSIRGRATTYPTQFVDEVTLCDALSREENRRDNLNLTAASIR